MKRQSNDRRAVIAVVAMVIRCGILLSLCFSTAAFLSVPQAFAAVTSVIASNDETLNLGDDYTVENLSAGVFEDAVQTQDASTINFGDRGSVTISGDASIGVATIGEGSVITFKDYADILAKGSSAYAVRTRGNSSDVRIGDYAKIAAKFEPSSYNQPSTFAAVYADAENSKITIGKSADISVTGAVPLSPDQRLWGAAVYTYIYGENSEITIGENAKISAIGANLSGVNAYATGSSVSIGGNSLITTEGEGSHGVVSWGEDTSISVGSGSKISVSGDHSYGAYSGANHWESINAKITLGDDMIIEATGRGAAGVAAAYGTNSQMIVGDRAKITVSGTNASGVSAFMGATTTVGDALVVSGDGYGVLGVGANGTDSTTRIGLSADIAVSGQVATAASAANGGLLEIGENATLRSQGDSARGLFVQTMKDGNPAKAVIGDNAHISIINTNSVPNEDSAAVLALDGAVVEIGGGAVITASGDNADGVRTNIRYGATDASLVTLSEDATITTTGNGGVGLHARATGAEIRAADNLIVTTHGEGASGIYSYLGGKVSAQDNAQIQTKGSYAYGTQASYGGTIAFGDSLDITTEGVYGYGVHAWGAEGYDISRVDIGDNASIATKESGAHGANAESYGAVEFKDNAQILIKGYGAFGAQASYGGTVAFGDSLDIATEGAYGHGVHAWGAEGYDISRVDIGDNASIVTHNDNAHGAYSTTYGAVEFKDNATIVTLGSAAHGTHAGGNSSVTFADGAVLATFGENAHGAHASGENASVLIGNDATVITSSDNAHGLRAASNGAVQVGNAASVATSGDTAHGVYSWWQGSVTLGDEAQVGTKGNDAHGVYAEYGTSKVSLGDSADILTTGAGSYAVYTNNKGSNYGPLDVEIGTNATIATQGAASHAVRADGGNIKIDDGAVISTEQNSAFGLYARSGGHISLSDDALITTKGNNASAAYAWFSGQVDIGDNAVILTEGANSYGARAQHRSGDIRIGDGLVMQTTGEAAHGLLANADATFEGSSVTTGDSADIRVFGKGAAAAYALYGGSVTVGENAYLLAAGSNASTVAARSEQSKVTVNNGATILATSVDSYAVAAFFNGEVELVGDMTIASLYDEDAVAMFTSGKNASGDVNARSASIHGNGLLNVRGGIVAEDYSSIDLTYQDGSTLTGFTSVGANDATLVMDMTNSDWDMTKSSSLTDLTLRDGSRVTFGDYRAPAGGAFMTLTTDRLAGDGNFMMRADIEHETADRVNVTDITAGTHVIHIDNDGAASTTGRERTILVETQDQNGAFTLANGEVEAGAYKYTLRTMGDGRGQYDGTGGQYWELHVEGSSGPGSSAVNTFIGNYFLTYAETDTLMKRLGDLRGDTQHSRHGYWFRGFGGNMESDSRAYAGAFDMDYWGVQVGYDNLLDRNRSWFKNGDTYVGGFIGFSKGDMDFDRFTYSKGDLENRTMGMYWTYAADTGYYFDAVAKYVWSKNDFNVRDSAGTLVQGGKINTGGVGLSFETGKRFRFNSGDGARAKGDKGLWYLEPQAQLSWQHLGSGTFHASNGLRIGVEGFDSLIGRLGVLIGYESARTNIYAKVSYLKEFDGDMNVRANDVYIYENLDDNWWVYGIGITHQLNPRNSLYFDLERSTGGDFQQNWNINAGWRISF